MERCLREWNGGVAWYPWGTREWSRVFRTFPATGRSDSGAVPCRDHGAPSAAPDGSAATPTDPVDIRRSHRPESRVSVPIPTAGYAAGGRLFFA
jgi:hypothetical protein